ncbi:MAG: hypothetical protein C0599_14535 [Salinivirgaceae bacterium]|nr:MAG: hypothetical protein C0599_14535 [Salinivirgaceae bacterium]
MKRIVTNIAEKRTLIVWHPTSPGEKVKVERTWFQRLLYPRYFATNKEINMNRSEIDLISMI